MFDTLLESHPRTAGPRWGLAVAALAHATVLLGLLIRPAAPVAAAVVIIPADSFPADPPEREPIGEPLPLPGFPDPWILSLPTPAPIVGLPEIPRPSIGSAKMVPPMQDSSWSSGDPWRSEMVQEAPVLLAIPVPAYPPRLREAGIQGEVIVEAVVDTLGRVEPASLRIVTSDQTGFEAAAAASIRVALFRPARVFGRPVRVLVRVPVAFRLR